MCCGTADPASGHMLSIVQARNVLYRGPRRLLCKDPARCLLCTGFEPHMLSENGKMGCAAIVIEGASQPGGWGHASDLLNGVW